MFDPANAAHLLAAAGSSWTAVDQHRERGTVPGRFGSVSAIDDQHPAMVGGRTLDKLARRLWRMGEEREREAPAAAVRQSDRIGHVSVWHDCRDWPERFDVVHSVCRPGIVGA